VKNKNLNIEKEFNGILNSQDLTSLNLKGEIVNLFNLYTNNHYNSSDLTLEQEKNIIRWMIKSDLWFISAKKADYYMRDWFINETDKHSWLLQNKCVLGKHSSWHLGFSIRIKPKSSNITNNKVKNEFQKLLKNDEFVKLKNNLSKGDKLYLKLICVINKTRDKDIDNMAKITIDGLKGTLFIDDSQIDHLEVIKFKTKYFEDIISVSVNKSSINDNNVIFRDLNMTWGSRKKLEVNIN
jgi:Holliday junction resolvase RusA-like endonuclease